LHCSSCFIEIRKNRHLNLNTQGRLHQQPKKDPVKRLFNRASWFSDDDCGGDDDDVDVHHFCEYCIITDDLFQSKINSELANNGVHIYQFPIDDDSVAEVNTSMNAHVPFAVVGSTDFVRVGNKMMRSRQYPWGTVQGTMFLNFGVDIFHLKHCSTRELYCCNLEIIPNCGPYLFRIYLHFFPFPFYLFGCFELLRLVRPTNYKSSYVCPLELLQVW